MRYAEGIRELDVSMGLCQTSASWGGATTALVLGPQSIVLGWGTNVGEDRECRHWSMEERLQEHSLGYKLSERTIWRSWESLRFKGECRFQP